MTPPLTPSCPSCDPRRPGQLGTACRCRPALSGPLEQRSAEPRDWTPWWTSLAANA